MQASNPDYTSSSLARRAQPHSCLSGLDECHFNENIGKVSTPVRKVAQGLQAFSTVDQASTLALSGIHQPGDYSRIVNANIKVMIKLMRLHWQIFSSWLRTVSHNSWIPELETLSNYGIPIPILTSQLC